MLTNESVAAGDEGERPVGPIAPLASQRAAPPASPKGPADRVDEAGRESFPASDPPSWSTMISRAPEEE